MARSSYSSTNTPKRGFVRRHLASLIAAIIVIAILLGIGWFVFGYWLDMDARFWQGAYQGLWLDTFFPNGWNVFQASWFSYVILGIVTAVVGWFVYSHRPRVGALVCTLGILITVANATIFPMWLNNMMPAASLSVGTIVTVEDLNNIPPAIRELVNKAQRVDDTTLRTDVRGYTTTIKQGKINLQWEARPASAKGAEIVMRSSGDSDTNSVLLSDTISFHSNGSWSGIRDGQNLKPIAGVSVWDGVSNSVKTCRFDGANELNYAFDGKWGSNLMDLIVSRFSDRLIDTRDMWGGCDESGAPMIVIPTTIREGYGQIRTPRFGGIIVVKGSPTGQPVMDLITTVKAGQFTGPVYPSTLAAQQRESFDKAAGILANWNTGFGTEPSTVQSQAANPSEYLLKSKVDGKLYWVTPVRPNKGESQQIIGYTVVAADSAQAGTLNENHLYFFGLDDPRIIDMSRLHAATQDAVNVAQPAFFTGTPAGALTELLPVTDGMWQAFAERGGRVVYRIDISTSAGVSTKVVSVGQPQTETPQTETQLSCGDATKLTNPELRECINRFLDELENNE